MNPVLESLARVVSESETLEDFVRPLLELMEAITGMESTYLTSISLDEQIQRVLFSRNSRQLHIPEGCEVAWSDTLCKRALEESCFYSDDVDRRWGDSQAARALGIISYISEPVRVGEKELYGTLCAASSYKVSINTDISILLPMFATLIARQIERGRLLAKLEKENRQYLEYALIDPLTGIMNRRALIQELSRALANSRRSGGVLHVAFLDLNGFKNINDSYGHDAGDRFLIQIAHALRNGLREGDFFARYGGDEFVIFGPTYSEDLQASCYAFQQRAKGLTTGVFDIGTMVINYAGASVGVITTTGEEGDCEAVLARADAAMYEVKKASRTNTPPAAKSLSE